MPIGRALKRISKRKEIRTTRLTRAARNLGYPRKLALELAGKDGKFVSAETAVNMYLDPNSIEAKVSKLNEGFDSQIHKYQRKEISKEAKRLQNEAKTRLKARRQKK